MIDFSSWTKQDFQAFDARRNEVFQPTPEEISAAEAGRKARDDAKISAVLSAVGLQVPQSYDKAFLLDFATRANIKQYVGENVEGWLDQQIAQFPTLEDTFRYFVVRYL